MAAAGLASAHLVGRSDGAVVGLLVALRRPEPVRRPVLIGRYANLEGARPEIHEAMKLDTTPALPPTLRELYAAVSPDGPDHQDMVVDKMWRLYRTEPTIPHGELATVPVPTLLIVSEHDVPTIEHVEAMQQELPDGRLEVVPGATQMLPIEQPET